MAATSENRSFPLGGDEYNFNKFKFSRASIRHSFTETSSTSNAICGHLFLLQRHLLALRSFAKMGLEPATETVVPLFAK